MEGDLNLAIVNYIPVNHPYIVLLILMWQMMMDGLQQKILTKNYMREEKF
jgi:hypothetical protein